MITIAFLADQPQHLPVVAAWVYDQWHRHRPGETLETTAEMFRAALQRDAIPLTLLALDGDVPVGTASLFADDMETRPELTPWLASVYVAPERRGAGIGPRLVRAAEDVARQLGVKQLYLFTPDRERFYARLGWRTVEHSAYDGHPVVIMARSLAGGEEPS